jgi:hypothetical protein
VGETVPGSGLARASWRLRAQPSRQLFWTVAALAYRTADAMRDRYFDAPGELLD